MNDGAAKSSEKKLTPAQTQYKQTHAQRTKWHAQQMQASAQSLVEQADNLFYLDVSIYRPRTNTGERMTVNVDVIFAPGTKPFKITANCISRSRKRELIKNVKDPDWYGYQAALDALSSVENGLIYAGKMKNRVPKYYAISRYIIPRTCVIVSKHATHYEVCLLINGAEYTIDCYPVQNTSTGKSEQYFTHRGSFQNDLEQEFDIEFED